MLYVLIRIDTWDGSNEDTQNTIILLTIEKAIILLKIEEIDTVDSRYLELQGTL